MNTYAVYRVRNDEKVATIDSAYVKVDEHAIIFYDGRNLSKPDYIYPVDHFYVIRLETPDA